MRWQMRSQKHAQTRCVSTTEWNAHKPVRDLGRIKKKWGESTHRAATGRVHVFCNGHSQGRHEWCGHSGHVSGANRELWSGASGLGTSAALFKATVFNRAHSTLRIFGGESELHLVFKHGKLSYRHMQICEMDSLDL